MPHISIMTTPPVFRTLQAPLTRAAEIARHARIVTIGSCFADNIGARLARDGFDVSVNAMGALYNPISMAAVVRRALAGVPYSTADLVCDGQGVWHCLDFESRRRNADADRLLEELNRDFAAFGDRLREADVWLVTLGTAWTFVYRPSGVVVGNCHKFPADVFERRRVDIGTIADTWQPLCAGRRVIFTVSPIRHLADGLHGNQLSKATLLLAAESLADVAEYFPAYEAVIDDLRDYRFYAADMKHISDVAADYIYNLFSDSYFSADTQRAALESRRQWLRAAHRSIL